MASKQVPESIWNCEKHKSLVWPTGYPLARVQMDTQCSDSIPLKHPHNHCAATHAADRFTICFRCKCTLKGMLSRSGIHHGHGPWASGYMHPQCEKKNHQPGSKMEIPHAVLKRLGSANNKEIHVLRYLRISVTTSNHTKPRSLAGWQCEIRLLIIPAWSTKGVQGWLVSNATFRYPVIRVFPYPLNIYRCIHSARRIWHRLPLQTTMETIQTVNALVMS